MRIAILAIPGVQMLDVAGPMDVFSDATMLLKGRSGYNVKIVALTMEPVTAQNGTRFLPDMSIEETLEGFDTLLIAGSPGVRQYEIIANFFSGSSAKHVTSAGLRRYAPAPSSSERRGCSTGAEPRHIGIRPHALPACFRQ